MRSSLSALILLSVLSISNVSLAQSSSSADRSIGLGASIQNEQFDIILPIWLGEKFVLAPAVGFLIAEDLGTEVDLGAMARFYFSNGTIAPYIGPKLGAILFSPANGSTTIDVLAGAMLGGEYFLHPQFSLGVEAQLNFIFSGDASTRFGNPGKMNINTGSAVYATLYF
jgi:hypothetical protein